ncbi:hypothetical protein BS47DRAFT_1403304 [Hydnum rufescens UP504]|uniref:FTP domain-containing protein n=1 Tax=Hydnum rufescens UP504 TaxID=1448309 RepID=A0A9P6AC03_9AGAM|nr:hypothetical protein BS47DRAFT_1403304 [Hydnum rufescens UP504]
MRSFLGLSLAFAVASVAHSTRRKSLGYGPKLPHARYVTDVTRVQTFAPLKEPKDVALLYLDSILSEGTASTLIEGRDFVFRDDSYTDDRTGVTHLYVRQVVNGIEVADGNINLNIMDGHVLSYGDSVC